MTSIQYTQPKTFIANGEGAEIWSIPIGKQTITTKSAWKCAELITSYEIGNQISQ